MARARDGALQGSIERERIIAETEPETETRLETDTGGDSNPKRPGGVQQMMGTDRTQFT